MTQDVHISARLNRSAVPALGQEQIIYVLIEVIPGDAMPVVALPLNVGLVLDKSGSMVGTKITRVKQAVGHVIDMLGADDVLALVAFAGSPSVLVESGPVGGSSARAELKDKVERLSASGGTRMARALGAGLDQLDAFGSGERVNRLILLTDGQTQHDDDDCRAAADRALASGVPITALGIGTDWNEDLLIDIGRRSGGFADYIADPADIGRHFAGAVQSMQATVARDASLTLRLVEGVHPRKVWRVVPLITDLGFAPIDDRFVTLPLGDLEQGQRQALLIELALPPRAAGSYRIAQAEVAYDVMRDPQATAILQRVQERARTDLVVDFVADPALAAASDPGVMSVVDKVQAFKLQTRALMEAELGNIAGATQKLRAAATILLDQGEVDLAMTMHGEATQMEQQGAMSGEGRKSIRFESGKTVKLGTADR